MRLFHPPPAILTPAVMLAIAAFLLSGCENTEERSPVGPNVGGHWAGVYSSPYGSQSITAEVEHDGETVVIKTSLSGQGHLLVGEISPDGYMLLVDTYTGNTWTSDGTVSPTQIRIHDWLLELGGHIEQAIHLSR